MNECPTAQTLADFLGSGLSVEEESSVGEHIETCAACEATLDGLVQGELPLNWSLLRAATPDAPLPRFLQELSQQAAPEGWHFGSDGSGRDSVVEPLEEDPGRQTNQPDKMPYINGYVVQEEIGRGGSGVVYRGLHRRLRRTVAIKTLPTIGHSERGSVERFQREAESLARLQHPNIVQIFEAGESAGIPFLAIEFVDGPTLSQYLHTNPVSVKTAAAIMQTLARATHYAHLQGVVHRDLKPGNVLLSRLKTPEEQKSWIPGQSGVDSISGAIPLECGVPKIADFGLAKLVATPSEFEEQTRHGTVLGTICYMSPEQSTGAIEAIGPATDIYSLGVILYEMLVGRPPFRAANPVETLRLVQQEEPLPPGQLLPSLPKDLETICLKCLAKDPAKRYPTAEELAEELARFLRGEPILARPVGRMERVARWARRNPAIAGAMVAAVLSMTSGTGVSVWYAFLADANAAKEKQARQEVEAGKKILDEKIASLSITTQFAADAAFAESGCIPATSVLNQVPLKLRGFEWYYRQNYFKGGYATLYGHVSRINSLSVSPDGRRMATGSWDRTVKVWDAETGAALVTLQGHTSSVNGVSFSPNGQRIASASADGTVKVWDARSGKEMQTLKGNDQVLTSVTYSPDGRQIASGSNDGTVKLWNIGTETKLLTLAGHKSVVSSVAFSPDGHRIASASGDATVKLWDSASGKELAALAGHAAEVSDVEFSPDGSQIVSSSNDATLKVWDAGTGTELASLEGHLSHVFCVSFSPDGQRIASSSGDKTVKVWDAGTGEEQMTLKGHWRSVGSVDFTPDGHGIVSASDDATVKMWDARVGNEQASLQGHKEGVTSLAFSPDSLRIVSGASPIHRNMTTADDGIRIWDALTGAELDVLEGHSNGVTSVTYSPDGHRITSGSRDATIRVWDAESRKELAVLAGHQDIVKSVSFGPDSRQIVSGSDDMSVKFWDADNKAMSVGPGGHTNMVFGVVFSPDGRRVASGSRDNTIKVWDAESRSVLRTLIGHSSWVWTVAFSPNSRLIASGSRDQTVKVWDTETGTEKLTLKGHTRDVRSVAFSPDGRCLASGSEDGLVKVWDIETGAERISLKGHQKQVWSVAFSPDGLCLASASEDHTVKLWRSGVAERPALVGHSDMISCVSFSSDGRVIASGAYDTTVRIWDSETGTTQHVLKGHQDIIEAISFSPDGRHIVSGSRDGTLRVWDIRTGQEQSTLNGHDEQVTSVSYSPDGRSIVSGSRDKTVIVWDADTGISKTRIEVGHWITQVAFSPDGQRILAEGIHAPFLLKTWDAETGRELPGEPDVAWFLADRRKHPHLELWLHPEGDIVRMIDTKILPHDLYVREGKRIFEPFAAEEEFRVSRTSYAKAFWKSRFAHYAPDKAEYWDAFRRECTDAATWHLMRQTCDLVLLKGPNDRANADRAWAIQQLATDAAHTE